MKHASVIAIDGPAASGKSTAAKNLATRLGIPYINTGSLYRAIAWKAGRTGVNMQDAKEIGQMLNITEIRYRAQSPGENPELEIDGMFPGNALRAPAIAEGASAVATLPNVRAYTFGIQRAAAKDGLVVMEGRDIGTAVFPDARYKFFLTASPRVRALRRLGQNGETPDGATVDSVAAEITARDKQDSERTVAPLKQAPDAVLIDSSELEQEQVLNLLVQKIGEKNRLERLSAGLSYRVPYADTDQMGVVYYANYLIYFEMARAELLRQIGFCYTEMEHAGFAMPVLEANCRYKASAHFEDALAIEAFITEVKGVKVRIDCEVRRNNELLCSGYTVHACIDTKSGRPSRPPKKLMDILGL